MAALREGKPVTFAESGNSMHPRIKHRQKCTYAPVGSHEDLKVGDAVFCKVGPWMFTHMITAIRGDHEHGFQYQISNNKGHVNGWTPLDKIYGKVIAVHDP
ncbi:MAG: phage repressor protein [Armatimonadetes bacterium]|nr:phage repressor protein [Armatimonadota bacterium]